LPDPVQALSPAAPRNRALNEAHAARLEKFERERLIVECLCHGLPVAEIAAQLDVSEKRMRAIIREILARRMPAPPEEFIAIQASRLNEALTLAHSAKTELALKKVDRVLRITRELDFYHGFGLAKRRRSAPPRLEAPAESALAFGAALVCRVESAPQNGPMIDFAPQIAVPEETAGIEATERRTRPAAAAETTAWAAAVAERPENRLQAIGNLDSAPGFGAPCSALPEREREPASQATVCREPPPPHASPASVAERPRNQLQAIENLDSAPGIGGPWPALPDREREPAFEVACLEPPAPAIYDSQACVVERLENPLQGIETTDSAPGIGSPWPALPDGEREPASAPRADRPFTPVFDRRPLNCGDDRVKFAEIIGSERQSFETPVEALGNSAQLSEPMDVSDGAGLQSERATAWKGIFRARPDHGTAVGLGERDPWTGPRISA
jgi:hypothetical protein